MSWRQQSRLQDKCGHWLQNAIAGVRQVLIPAASCAQRCWASRAAGRAGQLPHPPALLRRVPAAPAGWAWQPVRSLVPFQVSEPACNEQHVGLALAVLHSITRSIKLCQLRLLCGHCRHAGDNACRQSAADVLPLHSTHLRLPHARPHRRSWSKRDMLCMHRASLSERASDKC